MNNIQTDKKSTQVFLKKGKTHNVTMWMTLIAGGALLALISMISISKGAAEIPVSVVWDALFNFDSENSMHLIVRDLRLPRIIASMLVGSALAVSGAIMQGSTKNPVADSGLLGINAGAGFALAISFAFFPTLSYVNVIIVSFIGAAFGALLVNGIASFNRREVSPIRLVLAGAAVNLFLTALSQGIALYFEVAQSIMFWTVGGVAASNWVQVKIMAPWILGALITAMVISPHISMLSLGDDVSKGLGLNIKVTNFICFTIVTILAGISVSVVGAVGFVGLVIPHIARGLVGVDYRRVIPTSIVLGALLMVTADLAARTINPPFEVPIGALTSLIGVPFFLYLVRKQRRRF